MWVTWLNYVPRFLLDYFDYPLDKLVLSLMLLVAVFLSNTDTSDIFIAAMLGDFPIGHHFDGLVQDCSNSVV